MSGWLEGPVLGIETSGTLTGAALVIDGRLRAEMSVDFRAGAQELLLDLVRGVLAPHRLVPRDLARIGVSLGPGSFTGLRVGIAAARALALGSGAAAVGVPSHEALAWPWKDVGTTIVLLTGYRRGEVCLEAGLWEGDRWRAVVPGANVPVGDVPRLLAVPAASGGLLFTGEAVEFVHEAFPALRDSGRTVTERLALTRRPGAVAQLAARLEAIELRGADLERLEPLYLRGADARRPAQER